MPQRKPIAGFPSRTEACVALHVRGMSTCQIGQALDLNPSIVSALLSSKLGRTCGSGRRRTEDPLHGNGRTIVVSNDVLDALAPHAALRGQTVNQLVRDLLAQVVDDRLVDAVLDDAREPAPRSRQVSA